MILADIRSHGPIEDVSVIQETPPERHPRMHATFDALEEGKTLPLVNDREPKPLFYGLEAEVPGFDADGYERR